MLKIIMLHTNSKIDDILLYNNQLSKSKPKEYSGVKFSNNHLYLIDTEAEIEEGDWYLGHGFNKSFPLLAEKGDLQILNLSDQYKIIATTDKSLGILQLSEKSIELLIEYYNHNGKMPAEVSVEEHILASIQGAIIDLSGKESLKRTGERTVLESEIDITIPKENPIWLQKIMEVVDENIKQSVKIIYTKEEVESLIIKFKKDHFKHLSMNISDFRTWIDKNL